MRQRNDHRREVLGSQAVQVTHKGASLENGLLHVDLVHEIPEAMKPRAIPIISSRMALEVKPTQVRCLKLRPVRFWERPGFRGAFILSERHERRLTELWGLRALYRSGALIDRTGYRNLFS